MCVCPSHSYNKEWPIYAYVEDDVHVFGTLSRYTFSILCFLMHFKTLKCSSFGVFFLSLHRYNTFRFVREISIESFGQFPIIPIYVVWAFTILTSVFEIPMRIFSTKLIEVFMAFNLKRHFYSERSLLFFIIFAVLVFQIEIRKLNSKCIRK